MLKLKTPYRDGTSHIDMPTKSVAADSRVDIRRAR